MMWIKYIFFFAMLFFLSLNKSFAQNDDQQQPIEEKKIPFKDRIYTGGDIGLLFGSITYINVSPLVGLKATKRYSIGVGVNYEYLNFLGYSTSIYGGRFFNQYQIIDNVFVHAEYAALNLAYYNSFTSEMKRRWFGLPLIGGGFRQNIGGRSHLDLLMLYNLNDNYLLPYPNPIIRASVNIGI